MGAAAVAEPETRNIQSQRWSAASITPTLKIQHLKRFRCHGRRHLCRPVPAGMGVASGCGAGHQGVRQEKGMTRDRPENLPAPAASTRIKAVRGRTRWTTASEAGREQMDVADGAAGFPVLAAGIRPGAQHSGAGDGTADAGAQGQTMSGDWATSRHVYSLGQTANSVSTITKVRNDHRSSGITERRSRADNA